MFTVATVLLISAPPVLVSSAVEKKGGKGLANFVNHNDPRHRLVENPQGTVKWVDQLGQLTTYHK